MPLQGLTFMPSQFVEEARGRIEDGTKWRIPEAMKGIVVSGEAKRMSHRMDMCLLYNRPLARRTAHWVGPLCGCQGLITHREGHLCGCHRQIIPTEVVDLQYQLVGE